MGMYPQPRGGRAVPSLPSRGLSGLGKPEGGVNEISTDVIDCGHCKLGLSLAFSPQTFQDPQVVFDSLYCFLSEVLHG
jgi:hypothetical protein